MESEGLVEAARGNCLEDVMALSSSGADVNSLGGPGDVLGSALHWASKLNHLPIVRYLLTVGANVNILNPLQQTPLMWATEAGNLGVVHYLTQHGASLSQQDSKGYQAIHYAIQNDWSVLVEYYLEVGVSPQVRDHHYHTLLMWATYSKGIDILRHLLLHPESDVRAADDRGWTALHWAAQKGNNEALHLLVHHGADLHARTHSTIPYTSSPSPSSPPPLHPPGLHPQMTAIEIARAYHKHHSVSFLRGYLRAPRFLTTTEPSQRGLFTFLLGFMLFIADVVALSALPIYFSPLVVILITGFNYNITKYLHLGSKTRFKSRWNQGIFISAYLLSSIVWLTQLFHENTLSSFVYVLFQFLFLGLYTQVSFNDPGRVQGPRLSISEIVEEHLSKGQDITLLDPPASITTLCLVCKIKKPIRSKHCKESGYCIGRFDHYCTWTANAVGYKNHQKFVSVVLLAILNHSCFLYYSSHYYFLQNHYELLELEWVFPGGSHSLVFVLMVFHFLNILWQSAILFDQLRIILTNLTRNEAINVRRYPYLQYITPEKDIYFYNPFDRGYKENIKEFLREVNWSLVFTVPPKKWEEERKNLHKLIQKAPPTSDIQIKIY